MLVPGVAGNPKVSSDSLEKIDAVSAYQLKSIQQIYLNMDMTNELVNIDLHILITEK